MSKTSKVRQIPWLACAFLVLLRIGIGWQLLYEGLWKANTLNTPTPWSADGYLANSQGPLRQSFRKLADDPDGLKKLDYNTMTGEWDGFRNRFVHYFTTVPPEADRLTDEQIAEIDRLIDGPKEFVQPLSELPKDVDLSKFKFRKPTPAEGAYVKYDAANKRLVTNAHLLSAEAGDLVKLADKKDPKFAEYKTACQKLADRAGKLSLKERLKVLLVDDRDRNGLVQEQYADSVDHKRPGEVDVYRHLLARYEQDLAAARVKYQHDHLARQWSEIMDRKGQLTGPVDALTAELHAGAYHVLNVRQFRYGAVPVAPQSRINQAVIWGLIVLGGLLIVGLFSRLSSFGAAVMLLSFYLAMPPWPGIPEPPGPDHSLIVNKNLIECLACLALTFLPTGRWLGLDALVRRFIFRRTTD